MSQNGINYWEIKKTKSRITKMTNKALISEWKAIRNSNSICVGENFTNCGICGNNRLCLNSVVYEEVITDELISRGLLDYAINICYRTKVKKLPYTFLGSTELFQNGIIN
ncbi:MAG: hypothetical protein ACFFDW_00065 [Candidatus Thorarchaeota archaeon]